MNDAGVIELVGKFAAGGFDGIVYASGITEGQTAFAAAGIAKKTGNQVLIITSTYERARKMEEFLNFFAEDINIETLPDEERSLFAYDAKSRMLSYKRIESLITALSEKPAVFIAPVMSAVKGMCARREFQDSRIGFKIGMEIDFEDIRRRLAEIGYERTEMTEVRGQCSIRGGIIDIFPPSSEYPYRIDLFDTEVDDIKSFDPITQRSVRRFEEIDIPPAVIADPESGETADYIWDYMQKNSVIIADDWDRLCEQRELADREWASVMTAENSSEHMFKGIEIFADMTTLVSVMEKRPSLMTMPFNKTPKYTERLADMANINCVPAVVFSGRMDHYGEELRRLVKEGYEVHVVCATEERLKNLKDFAQRSELDAAYFGSSGKKTEDEGNAEDHINDNVSGTNSLSGANAELKDVIYESGFLPSGIYFTDDKIAYISDNDIFKNTKKKKRRKKSSKGKQIKAFTDLKKGDYVVHENHGIGRFTGIEPLVVEGIRKDYMTIQYAGKDVLYVPVEQMDLVQTYIGSGGASPKMNKLSSGDWKKTKAKAKAAIANMAEELVRLSAERTVEQGFAFSPDTPWQRQFEDMFPYQETENQLRCIEEIKGDMEMPWPMDRLLCGDVGFGKTEVAARAVFKCIMDGKQAAVLVPTTILANQHYHTFKERFESFPCSVDLLCRFRSEAQQKQAIENVENGSVDVLIGTHRILSKDIKFKDLGLLVIDEEQRFGVQHKEAIKHLKKNVDVLTLSATPIPRTLHMSLSGIRSMSTLEEPPEDRYPVQTYVLEQDDALIREIIMREVDRGGQAFVVYNRVKGINTVADGIRTLVPEARVAVAHGQMNEGKLEDIMLEFMDGEFDVLVATTIIESGIDIQNANTLIILDADNFGLAQLYQLRGRVGRSDKAAYAYFMYRKNKVLSEVAEKRLRAIKEFTEFGSGFRIAMKDLEIRGAGNLLGTEQSGHMMMIGYELYCKLIDDAVRKLRGEKVREEEPEVALEIKVDAFISSDYIEDEKLKLDMYKRIAEIKSAGDMSDVTDELIDRFGNIPAETESLMQVALIQARCREIGVKRVSLDSGKVLFEFFPENNGLTAEAVSNLSEVYGMKMVINIGARPFIKIPAAGRQKKLLSDITGFLELFA